MFECEPEPGCSCAECECSRAYATIADLRDRLRIMARVVCEDCHCAAGDSYAESDALLCSDCWAVDYSDEDTTGASVSVGLRALCGRRILEGCE